MSSTEDPKGGQPPAGDAASTQPEQPVFDHDSAYADDSYTYQGAPGPIRSLEPSPVAPSPAQPDPAPPPSNVPAVVPKPAPPAPPRQPPPPPPDEPGDEEEEGMLRMSFMEHLEELRKRILHMLAGVVI